MTNPFETIDQRLSNIEQMLQGIKHSDSTEKDKQSSKSNEDLRTSKEAAKFLGVSQVTLHKWKSIGMVKSYSIGTRIRYRQSDLEKALKSRQK